MAQLSSSSVYISADGEVHEPALGVHVLTEFVFCPRAGLCAFELGAVEPDETPPISFFAYNPLYSLAEIEACLQRRLNEMTVFVLAAACATILSVVLTEVVDRYMGLAVLIGTLFFAGLAVHRGMEAIYFHRQRRRAMTAKSKEPDPNSADVQEIHWWDLLKAGFETQSVNDRLIDQSLNFSGRPSRFLRRGNTIIPVWRMTHYDGQLHAQKYTIRMTSYCHLVKASLGPDVDCAYGVILYGFGFDGVAVPYTRANESAFLDALSNARALIDRKARPTETDLPDSPAKCRACPFGKPKMHQSNESEHVCKGKSLLVIAATAPDGKKYHSLCGDRFRWLPPHEDVMIIDLRLTMGPRTAEPTP